MRYSAHSADISSVALATKLKLAAVADAAGNVSLLDLLQPAQLFASRSMAQPVAQLAFGSHVFPGATKEEPDIERWVCATCCQLALPALCAQCIPCPVNLQPRSIHAVFFQSHVAAAHMS